MKFIYSIIISLYTVLLSSIYINYINNQKSDESIIINDKNNEVENYLIGVVACEMPALYNIEALKAQAVAARTFYYYELKNNKNISISDIPQCYFDESQMIEKWGNDYEKYYSKIQNAVNSTSSEVMLKENKLFKSYYFSTSNGYTEDSETVFNNLGISSVDSSWDTTSTTYELTTKFTKDELINILGIFENIKINKISNTNHVEEVIVDNKIYSGIEFRKILNLRSTSFTIKIENNDYYITTYGYGHGVGMSQYGANYLANNKNYDYMEILSYYYQDIDIKRIN